MLDTDVLEGTGKVSSYKHIVGSLAGQTFFARPLPLSHTTYRLLHFGRGTFRPHQSIVSPTLHSPVGPMSQRRTWMRTLSSGWGALQDRYRTFASQQRFT